MTKGACTINMPSFILISLLNVCAISIHLVSNVTDFYLAGSLFDAIGGKYKKLPIYETAKYSYAKRNICLFDLILYVPSIISHL